MSASRSRAEEVCRLTEATGFTLDEWQRAVVEAVLDE